MAEQIATLVQNTSLSPSVRHLVFRSEAGALDFQAGQWLNLRLPADAEAGKRAYSIANAPDPSDPTRFELAVTAVPDGAVSPRLNALPVGAQVHFDGPHGFFTRADHVGEPLLLVGTGTGIAPLRALIQETLGGPADAPPGGPGGLGGPGGGPGGSGGPGLHLLFGCRSQADILFEPELQAWQTAGQVRVDVTLSRPAAGWQGRTGYVQTQLAAVLGEARPPVFICGLSPMVKAVRQVLKGELGYDRRRIHSERYD